MNPKASFGVLDPPLRGIVPYNAWDNSTYKFQSTAFRNLSLITLLMQDSSNKPISVRYASEIGVSLQLTNSEALRFRNWSFTIKYMGLTGI